MRGDGVIAGEGRVVGVPKFHSRGECTVILRLRDTVERSIIHVKIHFTTKHVCYAHMLASYLTTVQISRLLKPHAHFVNCNNVILSTS